MSKIIGWDLWTMSGCNGKQLELFLWHVVILFLYLGRRMQWIMTMTIMYETSIEYEQASDTSYSPLFQYNIYLLDIVIHLLIIFFSFLFYCR